MTRIRLVFFCLLSLAFNACEMHPASELTGEHGAESVHTADAKHEPGAPHPAPHEAKAAADGTHGEAPKFFPEKK